MLGHGKFEAGFPVVKAVNVRPTKRRLIGLGMRSWRFGSLSSNRRG
jgi:hypothetical protein